MYNMYAICVFVCMCIYRCAHTEAQWQRTYKQLKESLSNYFRKKLLGNTYSTFHFPNVQFQINSENI